MNTTAHRTFPASVLPVFGIASALTLCSVAGCLSSAGSPEAQAPVREDAGREDAGREDAGREDAGREDAGNEDAGREDAGNEDAGNEDAGNEDAGNEDAGNEDAGREDAGREDAGREDAGREDAGREDAGREDAGHEDPGLCRQHQVGLPRPPRVFGSATVGAVADLDSDGNLDLVGSHHDSASGCSIVVARGNGDGTFAPELSYSVINTYVGPSTTHHEVVDLDGDGVLDLVISHTFRYLEAGSDVTGISVQVHWGLGDGTFADPLDLTRFALGPEYPWGGWVGVVQARDLDGDGRLDLVVGGRETAILINRGNRLFADPVLHASPGVGDGSIAVGDLDGDRHPDIVVGVTRADWSRTLDLDILLNRGDGTFAAAAEAPEDHFTVMQSRGLVLEDLDGDGALDLALVGTDVLKVLRGRGDGTFAEPILHPLPASSGGLWLTATDLDGDGRQDLLLSKDHGRDSFQATLTVFLNRGAEGFHAAATYPVVSPPLLAGDLDRDGRTDLVAGPGDLLFNQGGGSFVAAAIYPAPWMYLDFAPSPQLAAADLDGDEQPDLAVLARDGSVHLSRNEGGVLAASREVVGSPGRSRYEEINLVAADLDGNGSPDLAMMYAHALRIALNLGGGRFAVPLVLSASMSPWNRCVLSADDLDSDGQPDLLAACSDPGSPGGEAASRVYLFRNLGLGLFAEAEELPVPAAREIAVGDFDGDLLPDLAVAGHQGTRLMWNDGEGGHVPGPQLDDRAECVSAGDLDNDGRLDLVLSCFTHPYPVNEPGTTVLLNQGQRRFVEASERAITSSRDAVLSDLDGDGLLDLLSGSRVAFNRGAGGFCPEVVYPLPEYGRTPITVDLDGDDRLDLVTFSREADLLVVVLNREL